MRWHPSHSLENYLWWTLTLLCLPLPLLAAWWCWQQGLATWLVIALPLLLLLLSIRCIVAIKMRVMASYNRTLLQLDAIAQEDYHQYAKAPFPGGLVAEFHQQLNQLGAELQSKKSRYDQHVFLVYQLIAQLDTPVLVFNEKQQLTLANDAFQQLYVQPWQMYRHASAELLGLQQVAQHWQFNDKQPQQQRQKWQIKHSEFIDGEQRHQLLVFIDVESTMRASQLQAWQQIIRVLSHEIRNSLAPVLSLTESLTEHAATDRDRQVLQVISERCSHLQQFVNRYVNLSQKLMLDCRWLALAPMLQSLRELYPNSTISSELHVDEIWADATFFQQVLINLVKNAIEAGASEVHLCFRANERGAQIEIVDNGHGFANLDNLFVPLYSTKKDGQGIGLTFCRNIIEQHHGEMTLSNNAGQGVTVRILLPHPAKDQKSDVIAGLIPDIP